jgi:hypothetical protein
VKILEILGMLPDSPELNEMCRRLARRIFEMCGIRESYTLEIIGRGGAGIPLDDSLTTPAEQLEAEYVRLIPPHALSDVMPRLHQLDTNGTTAKLWRWLWLQWPLFREVFSAGLAGAAPGADRRHRKPDPNQPSQDRQNDIIATLVAKGTPLTRPELVAEMRLTTEGKLGHHLAWMVKREILTSIPQRGYWPKDHPIPN